MTTKTEGTCSSLFTHNVPPSFTITLDLSASMNIFKDNTLANFKISWVTKFAKTMESSSFENYPPFSDKQRNWQQHCVIQKDRFIASMKVEKDKISRTYLRETAKITKGEYTSIKQILDEVCRKIEIEKLDYVIDPITNLFFIMAALLGRYNFFKPVNS